MSDASLFFVFVPGQFSDAESDAINRARFRHFLNAIGPSYAGYGGRLQEVGPVKQGVKLSASSAEEALAKVGQALGRGPDADWEVMQGLY